MPSTHPPALWASAPARWHGMAAATPSYVTAGDAPKGAVTQVAGAIALAATQTAHPVRAARGEWVTDDQELLARAGSGEVDAILRTLRTDRPHSPGP
ncbi:DNA polymerase beta domain-containing protein [Streptomyces sp. NPDC092370]|uniref:DNA polymerase beta domain-containing protein n=1 Tax=Streptomyces sp. NPDC092370 TaxID=3366016 RepID=UPI0037F38A5A